MTYHSKPVLSDQFSVHENLAELVKKFQFGVYKKPIPMQVVKDFESVLINLKNNNNSNVIFDWGCGVGESTYILSKQYPDSFIIGVDKSDSRLKRKNSFKRNLPTNMMLLKGNIVDWWKVVAMQKHLLKIKKQYILFPNPYPKKKHLKLRWHAQPIFQSIMQINSPIEVRSNWKIYIEEFANALDIYFPDKKVFVEQYHPSHFLTPFEKKYYLSGQKLFRCILE